MEHSLTHLAMSPETERLVRESWEQMGTDAAGFSERFYARLFELDPAVRSLFAGADVSVQHRKFVEMLSGLIGVLDDPRRLVSALADAGSRHVAYGVRDSDYDMVGIALLDVIADSFGERFTPELRAAWRETYGLLAAVMRRGASRHRGRNGDAEPDCDVPGSNAVEAGVHDPAREASS